MPIPERDPRRELREGLQPGRGLNRTFFRSELPKVLLLVIAATLIKLVFFNEPEPAEQPVETWLNAPLAAADERQARESLDRALADAPRGFRQGMEERIMFLAYARLRQEGEQEGAKTPPAALDREALRKTGLDIARRMALTEKPGTLMHIVRMDEALKTKHPGWHKEFLALLGQRP